MIDLTVKTLDSQNHAFSLEDDQITVRGFKEYIAESVAVPADSQRLIYCGRVLQDEKKLNDYDINGKVIHLVQRAPPQPGQRGNDGGQGQGQNTQRTHYRLARTQMHANAMYLGAMSVPAEVVESHGLPVPQLSNSLSNSRLIVARRMLDHCNELMDRLDDPTCPLNPPTSESQQPPLSQQVPVQELETDHEENNEGRNNGARLAEAAAAAIAAALSAAGAHDVTFFRANSDEGADTRSTNDTSDDNQQDAQQQQTQPDQGSTSNGDAQSNRRSPQQLPRPPQMAELLERLLNTQDRLRPYIERYRVLMLADPSLPPGAGPEGVEENQRIVDGVSESLHYMSHACHALSDIIVDMGQQPPRNLRCRPIIIQHSAILQPGIPIQVEAHISLHGRNANNNGNEESTEGSATTTQSESTEAGAEQSNQQESEGSAQQRGEQPQQQQAQAPYGAVFNLSHNVDVLMEVIPEGNMDGMSGGAQNQNGETNNNNNNNNNNNTARITGAGVFPWGSAPSSDFIRNLVQAVTGQTVQGGVTNATISTRNPPLIVAGQQPIATSIDSGSTNAGQSTQARSNVGTHPTTATQTRSTSRPHVFQQQAHPLGIGMSIGPGLDFDPFLPCNSYHVRRSPTTTSSTVTATSQGTRTSQTPATETTAQSQPASTSTTTTNANTTNTTPPTSSQSSNSNFFVNILQQMLGGAAAGQQQTGGNVNSNNPDLAESLGNLMQVLSGDNILVEILGSGSNSSGSDSPTLADLMESRGIPINHLNPQEAGREENFLDSLSTLLVQNLTVERLVRLYIGQSEPITFLRRPVQELLQQTFPNATPEVIQERTTERLITQLRPDIQNMLTYQEDNSGRSSSRIDVCATVESILRRHIKDMLKVTFNNEVDDARFAQEILSLLDHFANQLCTVLRYCIPGGDAGLEAFASRYANGILEDAHPALRQWILNKFIVYFRTMTLRLPQPPESEIIPLLVYKEPPAQTSNVSTTPAHPPTPTPAESEPMETEVVEERRVYEAAIPDDGEDIPETFIGHEALPSDWVPIIARDGVRQRRQLQMQGMTNGGVTALSDAYLGALPTKRRKIIEQQKPQLLVSPTRNHSAVSASMERLVREGVGRAGIEHVEGAAVAVAADPGVRRAFGQAIRDCLNPRRYTSPDFPDPLRFPNATKYFAEQERPPK